MTDKALILGGDDVLDDNAVLPRGVSVQLRRDDGLLVTGSSQALEALAAGPGRVSSASTSRIQLGPTTWR